MHKTLSSWIKRLELSEDRVSTMIGAGVLLLVGVLFVSYFRQNQTPGEVVTQEAPTSGETSSAATGKRVVVEGETLWSIAKDEYDDGFKWPLIAAANGILEPESLEQGQELDVPRLDNLEETVAETTKEQATYQVLNGDSLWSVAERKYGDGFKWVDIYDLNREVISNADVIEVGQVLRLPE